MRHLSRAKYDRAFRDRRSAALTKAWEIRNFEIDLYWKRATYFWTIIGVLFAAYGVAKGQKLDREIPLAMACTGLVLGLAWYLINRASATWQKNWEAHVDALEDKVTGPLYKTVVATDQYKLFDLWGPYPLSPSRISIVISLFVTSLWGLLVTYEALSIWAPASLRSCLSIPGFLGLSALALTVVAIVSLLFAKTSRRRQHLRFEQRESSLD